MSIVKRSAHKAVERLVNYFGYKLVAQGMPVRGFTDFLRYVKARGFHPRTVFDVGVGQGTWWLYKAFPEAHHMLIEPLPEFEPVLRHICQRFDAEYHLMGAGSAPGEAYMHRPANAESSSFLQRTEHHVSLRGPAAVSEKKFPIQPLDMFSDRPGPLLLKIDAEGYERNVLEGARQLLSRAELVVLEVGVHPRLEGEAELVDLAAFLRDQGFRLFDIPDLSQHSADGPLGFLDAAFVRRDGMFYQ